MGLYAKGHVQMFNHFHEFHSVCCSSKNVQSATAPRLSVRASIVNEFRMELSETTSKLGPR